MPTLTSPPLENARRVFVKHGGMLRTGEAIRLGIHPRTLYMLRDQGDVERVGRGLYRLSSAQPLSNPDLVPIAVRVPRGVVCLISALAYHDLTTQVPHAIDLALPSHSQAPKTDGVPIRVFWFSEPSLSAGIDIVRIDNIPVRIYSPEKTIADCFKYRNKIGLDIAIEAVRTYRQRKRRADMQALAKYAQVNRVLTVMRPYLEALA
jgi:predicted transcriptional regulator of viral defense system